MIEIDVKDINAQRALCVLFQINNLYNSKGTYGLYYLVYDLLKESGYEIKFSKEIKDDLWNKARIKFNTKEKRLIGSWPEDKLKELLHKYFKSMLVAKYLMEKVETEGCMIVIDENTGKQIKMLNIVGYGK